MTTKLLLAWSSGPLLPILALGQTNAAPLGVGDKVPDVVLRDEENRPVRLQQWVAEKPTVLVFYRGGWCPYCNRHLQALATIEKEIEQAGAQMGAVSMDKPEKLRQTPQREKLHYRLFSDQDAEVARAFGIAFRVDDATVARYRDMGLDLEEASGRVHHLLPHPSVFIIDTSGRVRFAHVNPDYKVRLEPEKIMAALREVLR